MFYRHHTKGASHKVKAREHASHSNWRRLLRIEFHSDFSSVHLLSTPLRRLAFRLPVVLAINCRAYFHSYLLYKSSQNEKICGEKSFIYVFTGRQFNIRRFSFHVLNKTRQKRVQTFTNCTFTTRGTTFSFCARSYSFVSSLPLHTCPEILAFYEHKFLPRVSSLG